ncbi:hypothetical protein FOCC_FOCC013779 [Frankliniella occidentalis]|uniref:Uncharacterized protein LOC113217429 n=1 Tax=Frankliniella occidentalis TaxID=133901 RepID=A0A6J1TK37_FRAOC|nr:uncharacterized protein LOC113217429 [Frankliniella occidentalis]KAE8740687.1 hypothetical protein FOCC_FOCC013779 [Frankliniella occidentalis]
MDRVNRYYNDYINYLNRRRRATAIFGLILIEELRKRYPERSVWIHHYIARRDRLGCHNTLFLELSTENPEKYRKCLRMSPEMFQWLADKIRPLVEKQDTHLRRSISVEQRLSITLRHLATGETQESLHFQFRVGQSTISGIIKEVCEALYTVLKGTYLRFPESHEEWQNIAFECGSRWNFYNCIGAMDGKHILIEPPIKSGSTYYNYKCQFSIVLLAIVDAGLRFIYVDVGTNGRIGDKGVWNKCSMKTYLEENSGNIPPPCPLPGSEKNFPFVIVGDEGFTLSSRVMIPFSKEHLRGERTKARRIFNYRLSRVRRCSENAFGLIVNRFQILRSAMRYDPDAARSVTLAILCLHNLLRTDALGRKLYSPPEMLDREDELTGIIHRGGWREEMGNGLQNLGHQGGNRHAAEPLQLREDWADYFNGPGAVPWQDRMIAIPI